MAQAQNNITTLVISDPNGGQPQMIKVTGKLPLQFTSAAHGSVPSTSTIKTFIKTTAPGEVFSPGTIIQSNQPGTLLPTNKQVFAIPTKSGVNLQGLRPVVVPVSSVQLKPNRPGEQFSGGIIPGRSVSAALSSQMMIRTQNGNLTPVSSNSVSSSSTPIHLPQITVNKQLQQPAFVTTPILQAQLKQNATLKGVVTKQPSTITLKTQPAVVSSHKPSEVILVPQKQLQPLTKQPQQPSQPQGISAPKSLMNTSILDHSGSRKRHDFDFDYSVESKRRKTEKGSKGLRHFSMKVCEKVQAKGTTSYNEVADELVNEFSESTRSNSPAEGTNYDQKNIRRRVYDALNVLMAMNIISKEKKEIHWLGLPTNSLQECRRLEQERKKRLQKIKLKTQQLQDLILQQIAFKNLVERNRRLERECGAPSPNSTIQLPFIIVNTSKKTVIDCSISNDKTEYLFNFDDTFEIHDDIEVLKRMGMALGLEKGECSPDDLEKAKSLVPKVLEGYVNELAKNESGLWDSKMDMMDEGGNDIDSICDYDFDKADKDAATIDNKTGNMSRHSSLLSLTHDQRTESESPSSFGDYDGIEMDDSEVEL